MPYIKDKDKYDMVESIEELQNWIRSKGDLNYAICQLVGNLILDGKKISYTTMSEWIDAVHDAEQELRRRLLDPYEEKKMIENGDVPSFLSIFDRIAEDTKNEQS